MKTLRNIVHEIVFGSRRSKIQLIKELAGDEYEDVNSVFELAEKTDEQINMQLSRMFDYFSHTLK